MFSIQTALRHLTIRTCIPGAIVMLLSLFAVVGAAGVFGGLKLTTLNEHFMAHSMLEQPGVGNSRRASTNIPGAIDAPMQTEHHPKEPQ